MSEKVKSNILEMVVPNTYVCIVDIKTRKQAYRGHLGKWPTTPSNAKSDMALYQILL